MAGFGGGIPRIPEDPGTAQTRPIAMGLARTASSAATSSAFSVSSSGIVRCVPPQRNGRSAPLCGGQQMASAPASVKDSLRFFFFSARTKEKDQSTQRGTRRRGGGDAMVRPATASQQAPRQLPMSAAGRTAETRCLFHTLLTSPIAALPGWPAPRQCRWWDRDRKGARVYAEL